MRRLPTLLWLSLAGLGSAHAVDTVADFEPCRLGEGPQSLAAECASLPMPRDPELGLNQQNTLHLRIARIRAEGVAPADLAPVLFISGGPGQSALESWPGVASAFRRVQRQHDVILVDQRGTGASEALECPELEAEASALPDTDRSSAQARHCLSALQRDPRHYTTSLAVQDLERVRSALGIEAWNVYGVSYGTRVALHYLRRYPERVRAMILDAVLPPNVALGAEVPIHAQQSLQMIIDRCGDDVGCHAAFPDLQQEIDELYSRLLGEPMQVSYEDIGNGRQETMRFGALDLAVVTRLLSYSPHGAAILPSMLHAAAADNALAPLVRQAQLQNEVLSGTLATGMHSSVLCSEDAPLVTLDPNTREQLDDTWLGSAVVDALLAGCRDWPVGPVDVDFHEPVRAEVPVLLLSGEADPITPPAYAEQVATTLSRSRHLVLKGASHMQAANGCVPVLMAQFLNSPDPSALETDCLERYRPPAFFIDPNGPRP